VVETGSSMPELGSPAVPSTVSWVTIGRPAAVGNQRSGLREDD
jgi:hypothetical protein